jgi:DNA invertase Pin-like site-specific DNA recombinase
MTVYGYQRVSTREQNLGRQTEELLSYGIEPANIYTDKTSGGKAHRAGLDAMLAVLERGDKVVILSFDRLARSITQLLALSEDFERRGIELVSIKECVDTSTPTGKFFFTMTAAFAQFEREINNERTRQGLAVAKKSGKKLGRPVVNKQDLKRAIELYKSGGMTANEIAKATGISRATLYRYLQEESGE